MLIDLTDPFLRFDFLMRFKGDECCIIAERLTNSVFDAMTQDEFDTYLMDYSELNHDCITKQYDGYCFD